MSLYDNYLYEIINSNHDFDTLLEKADKEKIEIIKTDDCRLFFKVNILDTSIKKTKFRYYSKGMVLDELENKLLSIPSLPLNYYEHVNKTSFNELYINNNYDIIYAKNGTSVTLYDFNGTINMSTGKSYNISNYYWSGDKTFSQMFYESAQTNQEFVTNTKLNLSDNGHINWNIPENYCVTFGFSHTNIHKCIEKNDIWLIRCIDRDSKEDVELESLKCLIKNTYISEKLSLTDIIKNAIETNL